MDKNQKKIMPGCEKLTRPEEISSLKDYLKQGIQENENSLIIGDENPLMSTPGDPILGEIDLENQKLVMIDGSSVDIKRKSVNLDVSGDSNKAVPGDYLDKIQGGNSIDLSENRVNLRLGDLETEPSEDLKKLNLENKEINIENKKINLDPGDNNNPEIGSYRESLSALSDKELSLFSFLSELPGEKPTDITIDDQKRVSLGEIKNSDPEEKKVLLEKDEDVDLSQKRISLEKNEDPKLNSTLLEILENETDPEEKKVLLEKNEDPKLDSTLLEILENETDPEEKKVLLEKDEDVDLSQKRISLEKNEDPKLNSTLLEILENETDPEEKKVLLEKNEDPKLDSTLLEILENIDFEISQEIKHDLLENNINPSADDLKIIRKDQKTPENDNDTWANDNSTDHINIPQFGEYKVSRISDSGRNNITTWEDSDYNKNFIGDNNSEVNIPQFREYYKKVEDNKVDSGYTTWGSNVSHSLLFDGEDIITSEKDKDDRVIGFKSEGSKYTRKNFGDNYSTEDSSDRSETFNFIKTNDPKRLLDLNFDDGRLYKRLESISDVNERDAWKKVYETLGNISDEYIDERGEKVHISDGWKKELLEELLDKVSSYKNPSNVPNDAAGGNFSTWSSYTNTKFDSEYSRNYLGDNNFSGDSSEMKEKIEEDGSRKERVKRPSHQNPYLNINMGEDGKRKVDLGSALSNPLSLFKSGGQGIVSGVGETLNTELSITPVLRALAETISLIPGIPADIKQDLVDTALKYLVELRDKFQETQKISPYRLPGGDVSGLGKLMSGGSLKDIAKRFLEDTSGKNAPINRPSIDETTGELKTTEWSYFDESGVKRTRYFSEYLGVALDNLEDEKPSEKNPRFRTIKKALTETNKEEESVYDYDYVTNIEALGLKTTFEDLCLQMDSNNSVSSLEDLKQLLTKSPYVTNANQLREMKMSLDSNHIWEIRLFPFLGEINGKCSWLPSIAEMNSINWAEHQVRTRWGEWIPATSFELQTRKMSQKSLGLYDGEISYPVSMEFTNEVRLTLVDDHYKTWKRYFELCSECSTYFSGMVNNHSHLVNTLVTSGNELGRVKKDKKLYSQLGKEDLMSYADTTPIVRGLVCPGMYKNLTFRCLIYVMTGQFSTIQKFDLLLVLRDYSIEYSGEVDASSPDLTVTFSIVGENPADAIVAQERGNFINDTEDIHKQEGFFEKIKNDVKGLGNWKNSLGGVMDILS